MTKKEPLVIYWAPEVISSNVDHPNWNMLYSEPTNLFTELMHLKSKTSGLTSFLVCPATTDRLKNMFIFKNSIPTSVTYKVLEDESVEIIAEPHGVNVYSPRPSTLKGGAMLAVDLMYYFFCEESVLGFINAPMFHPPKYTNYGTIISGGFDLSKWFRPFSTELQMWSSSGIFKLEKDEPIFYLEIITDRPIILKRFTMTPLLNKYAKACVEHPSYFGRFKPLSQRYEQFLATRTNDLVLKEIKKNLL